MTFYGVLDGRVEWKLSLNRESVQNADALVRDVDALKGKTVTAEFRMLLKGLM